MTVHRFSHACSTTRLSFRSAEGDGGGGALHVCPWFGMGEMYSPLEQPQSPPGCSSLMEYQALQPPAEQQVQQYVGSPQLLPWFGMGVIEPPWMHSPASMGTFMLLGEYWALQPPAEHQVQHHSVAFAGAVAFIVAGAASMAVKKRASIVVCVDALVG